MSESQDSKRIRHPHLNCEVCGQGLALRERKAMVTVVRPGLGLAPLGNADDPVSRRGRA